MKNLNYKMGHFHTWHIVTLSPWPFIFSFSLITLPLILVNFFQGYIINFDFLIIAFLTILSIMFIWFRDIIFEGSIECEHTINVQKSLILGFILFLFSEVMFFISFFWGYFHSSLYPTIEIGLSWPPVYIENYIFDPFDIPFLNTLILLYSGATLTIAHLYLRIGVIKEVCNWLISTILCALLFIYFQGFEYFSANFDISDGIYGSTFFLCTGFHGFHVIIGTTFLIVILIRAYFYHFSQFHHIGFIAAAWYWHFVDVVWIFLYITIYFLGEDLVYSETLSIFYSYYFKYF